MRIALVAGLAALALASMVPGAGADVGPRRPDPARDACAGLQEGAACVVNDKAGSCHGPHVSRLYCQVGKPPSQGSAAGTAPAASAGSAADSAPDSSAATGSAATGSATTSGAATGSAAAGSATAGAQAAEPAAEPATTPGHKRGCAVTAPSGVLPVGLALAALALRRRRRSRSMS